MKSHFRAVHVNIPPTDMVNVSKIKTERKRRKIKSRSPKRTKMVLEPNRSFGMKCRKQIVSCDLCDFTCSRKCEIRIHIEIHAANDTYKCNLCDYTTNRKHNLRNHMKKHNGCAIEIKSIICDQCGKVFKYKSSMNIHMKIHALGISPDLICKLCNIQYVSENSIIVHTLQFHSNEKPQFACPKCSKPFYFEHNMKLHLRNLHAKEPVQCRDKDCTKIFANKIQMARHYQKSHKDNTNLCNQCGESFSSSLRLQSHMNTDHNVDKSHLLCQICGKRLKNENTFRLHTIRHQTDPTFRCDDCGKCFYTPRRLIKHQEVVHNPDRQPKAKSFVCHICPPGKSQFTSSSYLKGHIKDKHTDAKAELLCKYCGRMYVLSTQLRRHVVHSHFKQVGKEKHCGQCEKSFANPGVLDRHIKTIHQGFRYHCTLCTQTFSFRHTLMRHYNRSHSDGDLELYKEIVSNAELTCVQSI